jgi:pimeloyl-ACP methyl ester carboxylesterase/DNA-binding winged helix-turn-helix (wHTH) protein
MVFRFAACELDTDRRELRREGRPVVVQPRVFDVLAFLVRHRDRVVSKDELLTSLWPDVVVTDASVERAVSLARAAIGDTGRAIRTVPRHGYRFAATVVEAAPAVAAAAETFRPRFVSSGGVFVAYQTIGTGPVDLVLVPGWVFPMQAFFDHPEVAAWIERLTAVGRVVVFDKRGTGLSDRVKALPALEQRVDDLEAVLEAIGSTRAILIGISEGGPLSLVYAASYPERTAGLVLCGSFARWTGTPDYPCGWPPGMVSRLRDYITHEWGRGDTIRAIVASRGEDGTTAAWAARTEQAGASPGAALELLAMNLEIDVRPVLGAVSVPTVVLHSRGDEVIGVENGRYLAAHVPGARLVEFDGFDHAPFFEAAAPLLDAVAWLVARPAPAATRFLTTLTAVDGDPGIDDATLQEICTRFGGTRATIDRVWSFDGPQRAMRCGQAIQARLAPMPRAGIGVHAGEVARGAGGLSGSAIETVRAIARAATRGEVWTSRVVRDLVHGAPLLFAPRQAVALPGGSGVAVLAVVAHGSADDQPAERTVRRSGG